MVIIQPVIQLSASQRAEKCRVVLEPLADTAPNDFGFLVSLRERGNQDMEAVATTTTFVMHDVVFATDGRQNEAFPVGATPSPLTAA